MVHHNKVIVKLMYLLLFIFLSNIMVGCANPKGRANAYDMNYEITPIFSEEDILKIRLKLGNLDSNKSEIEFYTGDKLINVRYCKDNLGREVPFEYKEGVLIIPTKDKTHIEISYEVKIGMIGKHGYRGKIYDDLVVFDGGQALLFPIGFYTDSADPEEQINSISIACNVPEEWEEVLPFKRIISPTWHQLYALYNSCHAFGDIHKIEYHKGKASFYVFMDSGAVGMTDETEQGLNALFDYYTSLFGYQAEDFSIVLLRRDPQDMQYIIGGAGARSVGSTFDANSARDWQLMSHRMFHAFFESKFGPKLLFKPPQLWFYEGLATYYENSSMESLPKSLKDRLSLKPQELFSGLFKKYIYMKIKYHPLLSLAPMDEETIIESPAKTEFLHYTQAPLVIKAIEDLSYDETKRPDRILNYILDNNSNDEMLSVRNIVSNVLRDKHNEDFYNQYLISHRILPLWYLGDKEDNEDISRVIDELNYMEYVMWSWFGLDYGDYPPYILDADTLTVLYKSKKVYDVHFANEDVEEKVRNLSIAVYYALKEFALRADVCGVDFEDPIIKTKKLLNEENKKKWEAWLSAQ